MNIDTEHPEQFLGDWETDTLKFPHGLKPVFDHIKELGMNPESYKWYLDGEEIPGETGETLTIPWRRVRSHQAVVSVRPVWRLYGNEVLGEAQDINVEYQSLGCVMIIR